MSKNLEGIVASIRDIRAKKRPEVEANLQKIDNLLNALRATRSRADSVAGQYPDLKEALRGVSFADAENRLLEARTACEAALVRLRRDSINIGVAGKSGQGKSQILRMLTGLGDAQIPTGGGGACTAVQSIVHNSNEQKAVIHFLTKSGLLEKKVYPSFAPKGSSPFALGISSRPDTVEQFLSMDLSEILPKGDEEGAKSQAEENWDKVIALQAALNQDRGLISQLGAAPMEVGFGEVSTWLKKDNNETKHNIVDYVEMWTKFDDGLPIGLTVLDIPGLGDPTPGIEEDMLDNLKYKTDIVFFLRKPATDGSREMWWTEDHSAFDMIKSIYAANEVKPSDWVQLILNRDMRPEHWNEKTTELLQTSVPRGFTPVVCDCGSKDAVREMVDANIDSLVNQAGRIDDLRIRQANETVRVALAEANALYNALRNASGDVVAQESGFDFEIYWEEFQNWLRLPFRSQITPKGHQDDSLYPFSELAKEVLSERFKAAKAKFKTIYEANEDSLQFPAELPVFSKTRIKNLMGGQPGAEDVVNLAVRNQREAVLKFIRVELTECCDELMNQYFEKVVSIGFDGNPALKLFGGEKGKVVSRERIAGFLASVRQSGSFPTIESAAEELQAFSLTFEDTILPAIYSTGELDDFDPDRSFEDKKAIVEDDSEEMEEVVRQIDRVKKHINTQIPVADAEGRAKYLFNWLKMKSGSVVSAMTSGSDESAVAVIAKYVAAAMKANYDAFVYRFIWGADCTNEWRRLADHNKSVFWKDEFEAKAANSRLAKDWNAALADFAAAL